MFICLNGTSEEADRRKILVKSAQEWNPLLLFSNKEFSMILRPNHCTKIEIWALWVNYLQSIDLKLFHQNILYWNFGRWAKKEKEKKSIKILGAGVWILLLPCTVSVDTPTAGWTRGPHSPTTAVAVQSGNHLGQFSGGSGGTVEHHSIQQTPHRHLRHWAKCNSWSDLSWKQLPPMGKFMCFNQNYIFL